MGQFASDRDVPHPVDVSAFLAQLVETGRLPRELHDRLAARLEELTSGGDSARLAHELRRVGAVTSFQALRLSDGRIEELFVGRHLLLESLGQGAMGAVYRAVHIGTGEERAIKVVRNAGESRRSLAERLRNEAIVLQQLTHPHIVAVHESNFGDNLSFLAMEYLLGRSLDREVARRGPLDVRTALVIALQAARGLSHVHEHRIVHRDVKPNNLMLSDLGQVKLIDFGLAMQLEAVFEQRPGEDGTQRGQEGNTFLGSVNFLAPEQAVDPHSVDERADIYGLGCTLFYLLTGQAPYDIGDRASRLLAHRSAPIPRLRATRPDVLQSLDELCARMMAKSVADRPRVMWEVIEGLESCLAELVSNSYDDTEIIEAPPVRPRPHAEGDPIEDTLPLPSGRANGIAGGATVRHPPLPASAGVAVLIVCSVLASMVTLPRLWWGSPTVPERDGGDLVEAVPVIEGDAPATAQAIDLLEIIDLDRNVLHGTNWRRRETEVVTGTGEPAILEVPAEVPAEYELELVVTRRDANGPLVLGVVFAESCGVIVFDDAGDRCCGGLGVSADQELLVTTDRRWLQTGVESQLHVAVGPSRVEVSCNGASVLRYEGDLTELTRGSAWTRSDPRCLFVGTERAAFVIHRFLLVPNQVVQTALVDSPF